MAAVPLAAQADELTVSAVRFYRTEAAQTRVNAFIQVPVGFLSPLAGGRGNLAYRVVIEVTDSAGGALQRDTWSSRVQDAPEGSGAVALEMIQFGLAPGRYSLRVAVQDSATGRKLDKAVVVEGYPAAPQASDLLLSPRMRVAAESDTLPETSELRWGSTLITGAARLELTPLRATAYYLLEAYGAEEKAGTLVARIMDSTGAEVTRSAPGVVRLPAGGGVFKGQMDLTGLPSGRYRMAVRLTLGDAEIERSAPFEMADLERTLVRDVSRREALLESDQGYFDLMPEAALDDAEAPLTLIAEGSELRVYQKTMTAAAKRRFLADFWIRHDPSPGTRKNEYREEFYARVDYANRTYREGGRTTVGWRTDRGRIYVRNGAPDDVLHRVPAGKAPPYEAWSYRKRKSQYYCFADRTGFGGYKLVYTNDLRESSLPNWRQILTEEGVADIGRFLGVDFFAGGGFAN